MGTNIAVFKDSDNINVNGGLIIVNEGTNKHETLDVSYLKTASLNAILNAGGRADEVRCYPGTREEVIGKVERWMDGQSEPDRRILWLNGHAGAGKSAIAQTVAENGAERVVDAVNFFFFRTDNTRNRARPLVATLVYQLVKLYPALREHLTDALKAQPLASTASVKQQFAQLLASPIENLRRSSGDNREITLIIDGLDECEDEAEQLEVFAALHELVRKPGSPFRVMVASRVEPQIVRFFNKITDSVQSLFLSSEYRPEDDIRKFVIAKFDEIKRTHHLAHTLGEHWPTRTDVDKIVSKSSGQFVYAATVMRFMEYSKDSPAVSLLTVHEIRQPTNHSPFAQLDALYSYIFSKARDIRAIKWVIAFVFMKHAYDGPKMLRIGGYEPIDIESLSADISAIAQITMGGLLSLDVQFYHASLPDYLRNKSRSGVYHVDVQEILADLAYLMQATTELTESLLNASKRRLDHDFPNPADFQELLTQIIMLYFTTDKALCGRILHGWIRFGYMHKLNVEVPKHDVGLPAYHYFRKIRLTEKAKFVISNAFTRDSR